jgi:DNA (cytosine-5)-methyltransferase 1
MIKVFEMFSGYGGASFALKKLGLDYDCVGISEIDKYAIQCYNNNFPNIKNYGDCKKINPTDLPDFDLLTGGFPCQAFSIAGKGKGELDPRGTLFYDIVRIAEVKKPKYMLLENVKGLTTKKHKETFNKIISELNRVGYDVIWKVLNSKNHGIPQNRERVFFVCKLGKWEFNEFQFPTEEPLKIFIKDILEEEINEKYYLSELIQKRFEDFLKKKTDDELNKNCIVNLELTAKKRAFETPKEINQFLKDNKGNNTISKLSESLNLPKTQVEHYFRTDKSRAIPTPEIWNKLKSILNFNDTYDKEVLSIYEKEIEFEQTRRVYNDSGTSPTLNTIQEPIIYDRKGFDSRTKGFRESAVCPTLSTKMGTGGNNVPMIQQPLILTGLQEHQSMKIDGISNALPSAMGLGGGHVPMVINRVGYDGESEFRESEISPTLSSRDWKSPKMIFLGKLRRLTPKECFRLQGFLNDEINLKEISDTQKYKLAGNGWEINLVSKILKEMFKQ